MVLIKKKKKKDNNLLELIFFPRSFEFFIKNKLKIKHNTDVLSSRALEKGEKKLEGVREGNNLPYGLRGI